MILISACLLGEKCKYNGGDNFSSAVKEYIGEQAYVLVCPEALGGLPIPRPPAEIYEGRVVNAKGKDITCQFITGAKKTLGIAKDIKADLCILKEGSPSCGKNLIYDGKFRNRKMPGQGVTAKLLAANGFKIISEMEINH